MKRILLLLSIFALAYNAFSQLNLNSFESKRYYNSPFNVIEIIMEDNSEVKTYELIEYEFQNGDLIELYGFLDSKNNLLDIIMITKDFNKRYEINVYNKLNWNRERYIRGIVKEGNNYKLLMSDNSYITINFEVNKKGKTQNYCTESYFKCLIEDHVSEKNYVFWGYGSKYEYVECK